MTRVKPWAVGLFSASVVFIGGLMGWSRLSTPNPSTPQPHVSVAMSTTAAAPVDSVVQVVPVASASVAANVEPVPEKPVVRCPREPLVEIPHREIPANDKELFQVLQENPRALGSASIGAPTRGSLFGGVELPESEAIKHEGGYAWGTELVVRSIERAVREVRRCFANTPILRVGDISRNKGGWLKPHRSHQSGIDADIGYFYRVPAGWYEKATAGNLDLPRTWALVRAFIEGGNVDTIFIDLTIQRILQEYVGKLPKDEQPPEQWFQSPLKKDTAIRHAWGHITHFHVRFRDPEAVALGTRIRDLVPRLQKAKPKRR
ncbi:MAG TPA: penicillin-insensitive murein endopeptidase [Polyangium sp.]|nr:penicillin-insensitive murein endopeptidase [Polyangium sp.]